MATLQLILVCIFLGALLVWATVIPASWIERAIDWLWRLSLRIRGRYPRPY